MITGVISGEASEWTVGEVTTNTIDAGMPANADIYYNEDTNAYDFQFDIPKGVDGKGQTNVKVAGVVQSEVNFDSDPQSQINDVATDINNLETEINNINFNINTKANLDASNLSGENVTSWSNKLGIEAVTTELESRAKSDASNLTNENIASWANKFYPVGSIYMSVNNTSPASFLGGTWEQIKDTFLLSAGDTYTNGSTGGEATHTLTVDEMPSHTHGTPVKSGSYTTMDGSGNTWVPIYNNDFVGYTGGSQAHNNMPPYLAVYMWKRVA